MTLAVILFAAALALIASERVDRTKVALAGAVLVIVTQTIEQDAAFDAIDWNTIGLLAGMMLMVRLTEPTGVYNWLAIKAGQLSGGRPLPVVLALGGTTALLSAFLDNLTTVLLMVPITFLLADALDIDPIPLVIIEIVVSNIGGTATLIGDPPNIIIAGATGLSFISFITNLAPIAFVTFVVVTTGLYFFYRDRLRAAPEARARVMELDASRSIEDPDELRRTVPVLVGTILVFFLHQALHLEPATVAMGGATVMLFTSRQSLEGALVRHRVADAVLLPRPVRDGRRARGDRRDRRGRRGDRRPHRRQPQRRAAGDRVGLGAGLGARRQHPVHGGDDPGRRSQLEGDDAYWWALALGACFGGNATLVAAAANVAAAGMAARAGQPIGFMTFLRIGVPVTLVSMVLATGYIALRYL